MTAGETAEEGGLSTPFEFVFGESVPPEDCRVVNDMIGCSPLNHHADPLSVETNYELLKRSPDDMIRGSGLTPAKDHPRGVPASYRVRTADRSRSLCGGRHALSSGASVNSLLWVRAGCNW